jgi:hypothetical protein
MLDKPINQMFETKHAVFPDLKLMGDQKFAKYSEEDFVIAVVNLTFNYCESFGLTLYSNNKHAHFNLSQILIDFGINRVDVTKGGNGYTEITEISFISQRRLLLVFKEGKFGIEMDISKFLDARSQNDIEITKKSDLNIRHVRNPFNYLKKKYGPKLKRFWINSEPLEARREIACDEM